MACVIDLLFLSIKGRQAEQPSLKCVQLQLFEVLLGCLQHNSDVCRVVIRSLAFQMNSSLCATGQRLSQSIFAELPWASHSHHSSRYFPPDSHHLRMTQCSGCLTHGINCPKRAGDLQKENNEHIAQFTKIDQSWVIISCKGTKKN